MRSRLRQAEGVPLDIVQRWLGHARIETTAVFASAIGDEEESGQENLELTGISDSGVEPDTTLRHLNEMQMISMPFSFAQR